ncbi:MAG: hypothetical protein J5974_08785, partial [Pyramidobacter sp.]|nr:hypothetical protein [Pyramidobacter sp.]
SQKMAAENRSAASDLLRSILHHRRRKVKSKTLNTGAIYFQPALYSSKVRNLYLSEKAKNKIPKLSQNSKITFTMQKRRAGNSSSRRGIFALCSMWNDKLSAGEKCFLKTFPRPRR